MNLADWRHVERNFKILCVFNQNYQTMGSIWYQPIWRLRNKSVDPRGSDTNSGQTNYDDLFADPVAWMENCWIDDLTPQLY
jgi:uncharacterized lipoprotein YddW (UPF0748 family)